MKAYYSIANSNIDGLTGIFDVRMNPDCEVYEGHFPDFKVSPGVCNIRMMLECAERVAQHTLRIQTISRCRFTTLISPLTHPELEIHIELQPKENQAYTLNATIGKDAEIYQLLKANVVLDE